jgi:general secretion pathway protein C
MPPWATRLLILAIFALGLALGLNALFSKLLAVDPTRLAEASIGSQGAVVSTETEKSSSGQELKDAKSHRTNKAAIGKLSYFLDPILKRNIFDSTASPESATAVGDNKEGGDELRKSELEVTLIAVAVASPSSWSTALASVGAGSVQVYRIGDPILTAVVHDIQRPYLSEDGKHHPARLIVLREGSMEYVDAGGPAPKGKKKAKPDKKKKKTKKKKGGRHKWTGIRKVSDTKYTIDQSEVDYALGNLDKLSREARVVPNFQDGATNGFKVFSIRRNSALRKMGVKNNDVLTGVNNFDLSNTQKALEIYSKLQTEKTFRLDILRNGEPMTLEYDIQ